LRSAYAPALASKYPKSRCRCIQWKDGGEEKLYAGVRGADAPGKAPANCGAGSVGSWHAGGLATAKKGGRAAGGPDAAHAPIKSTVRLKTRSVR
jgi:hypothetical protein